MHPSQNTLIIYGPPFCYAVALLTPSPSHALTNPSCLSGSLQSQIILQHYRRILAQWPTDLLRPSVSFQAAIQHRISTRLMTPSTSPPPRPQDNIKVNEAQVTIPTLSATTSIKATTTTRNDDIKNAAPPSIFDEKAELEQINVLYSLLENRYSKKVCLPICPFCPGSSFPKALVALLETLICHVRSG